MDTKKFTLMMKAEQNGVFSSKRGCLISAPTATGKSQIGIEVIRRNLRSKTVSETFLYLVPFKALAEEMYYKLQHELADGTKVNIKTGDYDTPFDLKETDVLVATYESADGIIQEGRDFYPTLVIADEFSIIADPHRGAKIESLMSFLAKRPNTKLFALSAVLKDPEKVAKWLRVSVLKGVEKDRPVPLKVKCVTYTNKGETVKRLVKRELKNGSVLIFCYRKRDTEDLCFRLRDLVAKTMSQKEKLQATEYSRKLKNRFPYLVDLPELVKTGIAYHHADLELDLRKEIERGFRERKIKLLVATTTLSAGVNLPARTVIVRDITRYEGRPRLLSISEMVNMLGRAGRPTLDDVGIGYYLVPKNRAGQKEYKNFIECVNNRRVEEIRSQIPRDMTNILHFILSVAARMRGIERDDLISAYNGSFWGFENPQKSSIPKGKELREGIGQFLKPQHGVKIKRNSVSVVRGVLRAKGGTEDYDISISRNGSSCSCPAYTYRNRRPCKHIRQLQYEVIKGEIARENPEAKRIAIDSLKEMQLWENPAYALAMGVEILLDSGFLEERDGKLYITQDGRQALVSYLLSMDHVRILRDRIKNVTSIKDEEDIIKWAVEDYREQPQGETEYGSSGRKGGGLPKDLERALWEHIKGKQYREILERRWIKKFLDAKDRLDQIFNAYHAFCPKDNVSLALQIRVARRRVHYGCKKNILPLMVLGIREIDDSRKASKLFNNGIKNVKDLSKTSKKRVSKLLGIAFDEASRAVEKAKSICKLVSKFSGERGQLNTLAAQTGVKIDDLLDYLLPTQMAEALRKF